MNKLLVIWMTIWMYALVSGTAFPQAQYLIDGENPASVFENHSVTISLDPAGIINTSLITAGCLISYDSSSVFITNVVAADSDVGGPWDAGWTTLVPEADGPGTYSVMVGNWNTVPVNNPIPICDLEFDCGGFCYSSPIIISTIPGFDTVVGDTTVWDSQITDGLIEPQTVHLCLCDLTGPSIVEGDILYEVTEQYTANPGPHCVNPPAYVWSDDCTLGDVNQNGLLTVPPTQMSEVCTITVLDTANTDINTGEPVECEMSIEIREGGCADEDWDGILDCDDNCPEIPNGWAVGTCTSGTVGVGCNDHDDCGTGGFCSKDQEDTDVDGLGDVCDNCPIDYNPNQEDELPLPAGNGIPDACDCEGNFDCDGDCDGTDASQFKIDFGRSGFNNLCEYFDPCNGDFDCDGDVDGTDAALFKDDFGRSGFNNPCPSCTIGRWCVYNITLCYEPDDCGEGECCGYASIQETGSGDPLYCTPKTNDAVCYFCTSESDCMYSTISPCCCTTCPFLGSQESLCTSPDFCATFCQSTCLP